MSLSTRPERRLPACRWICSKVILALLPEEVRLLLRVYPATAATGGPAAAVVAADSCVFILLP